MDRLINILLKRRSFHSPQGCRERAAGTPSTASEGLARVRGAAGAAPPPLPPPSCERVPPAPPLATRTKSETRTQRGRRASVSGAPDPSRSLGAGGNHRAARSRVWGRAEGGSSSDSGDSGSSLLCALAPRWLSAQARQRRRARRPPPSVTAAATPALPPAPPPPNIDQGPGPGSGAWSVTVAGSCRAALPADVEMRLRFPHDSITDPRAPAPHSCAATARTGYQQCTCVQCSACAGAGARTALLPASPATARDPRLTLTLKKEAQDSSILASKSLRKSSEQLPELETYRASRTKLKSSVKTRRGYSLHCWLPDDEPAPIRVNNGLSVLGCAIIPELKPRVPTMSERDLTRIYTPRQYLRS